MSEDTLHQDELTTLKARADLLGIQYHPSIGLEKLRAKVAESMAETPSSAPAPTAGPAAVAVVETEGQMRKRLKNESSELVRIRLTCMNPAKKDWAGEIFTVGNSIVGTFKKYVPFVDADDGWHVPRIMLEVLKDRQCQIFSTLKSKNGISVRQGKLIKEFAIEILEPLTKTELHDLAQRQAMAQSIG